jgi:GNAT superfamily N-acetyltransferase
VLLQAGSLRAVTGQEVELVERARIEQEVDALAGEHLALGVLSLDRSGRAGLEGLGLATLEVRDPLFERVIGHAPQITGHHVAVIQVVEGRIDVEPGLTLVAALLDELRTLYGEEDEDAPSPDDLASPKGVFLVASRNREPVGCGGIKHFADGIAEVKRMYVVPAARRSGVARAVLAEVEAEARRRGYRELRLETGVKQPEAIALYQSAGFELIPCWGVYARAPSSRCLAKRLE